MRDFTSLQPGTPSYTLVFNREGRKELVKLELDETVVQDMRRMAPRKVFTD